MKGTDVSTPREGVPRGQERTPSVGAIFRSEIRPRQIGKALDTRVECQDAGHFVHKTLAWKSKEEIKQSKTDHFDLDTAPTEIEDEVTLHEDIKFFVGIL